MSMVEGEGAWGPGREGGGGGGWGRVLIERGGGGLGWRGDSIFAPSLLAAACPATFLHNPPQCFAILNSSTALHHRRKQQPGSRLVRCLRRRPILQNACLQ